MRGLCNSLDQLSCICTTLTKSWQRIDINFTTQVISFVHRDSVSQPRLEFHDDEDSDEDNGNIHTERQNDALTVKKQFFANIEKV